MALTLTSEFSPSRIRGRMTGTMMAAFPVGLVLAALVSLWLLPTYGWRAIFIAGIVPALLLFFVRMVMPESVRYLLSRGRVEEAEAAGEDDLAAGRMVNRGRVALLSSLSNRSRISSLAREIFLSHREMVSGIRLAWLKSTMAFSMAISCSRVKPSVFLDCKNSLISVRLFLLPAVLPRTAG